MALTVPPKIDPNEFGDILQAGRDLRQSLIDEAALDLPEVAERTLERQMMMYRILEAIVRRDFGPWDD